MPRPDSITPLQPEPYGIDGVAFSEIGAVLGATLRKVITNYLIDTENYLNSIEDALSRNDIKAAILPAHSIKSSSQSLGAMVLATLAERAEQAAHTITKGGAAESMAPLLAAMREAFAAARPFLEAQLQQP